MLTDLTGILYNGAIDGERSFLRILTQDQRSFGVSENFKIRDPRSSRGSKNL